MTRRTWTAVHSAVNRSLKLAELRDHGARLFFHQLLQAVDSHGCIDARPHILLVEVWPLLGETIASTEAAVRDLERVGLVVRKRDERAEWLEIPDWNEKAGALIRRRGKRTFGTEPIPERARREQRAPAPLPQSRPQVPDNAPEVRTSPGESGTASNSNSPSRSSLADSPAGTSRVSRARGDAPPDRPTALTDTAREQLEFHPTLKTTEVCAALVRWENHLRDHGKLDSWRSGTWASNLATWATWGAARLVRAIDTTIRAGKFTPFEPRHGDAPQAAAKPDPTATRSQAERAARERDIERRWEAAHTVQREMPSPAGGTVVRAVLDAKYPGHEAAERELRAAGLLNGHASASPATPVGVRT